MVEQSSIAKIATEALKPASAVIDALLGPKLKRIRIWAEQQELNSRLENPMIDVILDQYLRSLLKRLCGITTIVFPQQVLPLTSIYEPLTLTEMYARSRSSEASSNSRFGVHRIQLGENYVIVDSAGMGKSTYAKHLVLEILKFTEYIPIFLELRRIAENQSLTEAIASDIDESGNYIDRTSLQLLLNDGGFIVILDGYDEIAEETRAEIGNQITTLALTGNRNSVILLRDQR